AARLVVADEAANALCAMRPPGHHAESDRAMGFCLLNSAAIAALTAIEELGMARVAIVDFDVHHGNGTQEIFERDPRVFYASSHEWPLYPGTGAKHETGVGNIVNAHLPAFSGSSAFRAAYETEILPALSAFAPELVIASAGFDAHQADPLANIGLTEDDFAWVTERLCEAARESAGGRLVSVLEGGYALEALAASAAAHVRVLTRHSGR
ncbi:MAG: histone deacetylase family protein, partial [Pseudomonadota bacterium]